MAKYFISVAGDGMDGWLQASFGNSIIDQQDYALTTSGLKADEVPIAMNDAKSSSEMCAGLLNCFYSGVDATKLNETQICALGRKEKEVPHPANATLPFPEDDLKKGPIPF